MLGDRRNLLRSSTMWRIFQSLGYLASSGKVTMHYGVATEVTCTSDPMQILSKA